MSPNPSFFDCPHCGKPVMAMKPTKKPIPQEQHVLPSGNLDEQLSDYAELLEIVVMEGKTSYRFKEWQEKTTFAKVNEIMTAYGGKWISEKKSSRWEVPT